jgi:hypothetical protein
VDSSKQKIINYKGPGPRNPMKDVRGDYATLYPSGAGGISPGHRFKSVGGRYYFVAEGGNFVRVSNREYYSQAQEVNDGE